MRRRRQTPNSLLSPPKLVIAEDEARIVTRTVRDALAESRLDPREAALLLREALRVEAAYLIAHPERVLTPAETGLYQEWVSRRQAGEPVAYLVGKKEFYGLEFRVTPDVLIPRPETELLVELALPHVPNGEPSRVLDLGTGSGILAITLAKYRPKAAVTATDRSAEALAVAQANARRLEVLNVAFVTGNWYAPVGRRRFDLIVSNPPYVAPEDPHLGQGDLRFEPQAALKDGAADGLGSIRAIIAGASEHLKPGGWLLFEHGYDQAEACRKLLAETGFTDVFSGRDLAGIERVSAGRRKLTGEPGKG